MSGPAATHGHEQPLPGVPTPTGQFQAVSEPRRWDRHAAIYRIHDAITDLTEPRHVTEHYEYQITEHQRRPAQHVQTLPGLLQALQDAIEPGGDNGQATGGRSFESRPPVRLDPIKVLRDIGRGARQWTQTLGLSRQTTRGHLMAIKSVASTMPDDLVNDLDRDTKTWIRQAKQATGEEPMPITLDQPCPECWKRNKLTITGTLDYAHCVNCDTTWDQDTIGLLGQMLTANTTEETISKTRCDHTDEGLRCYRYTNHDGYHLTQTGRYWATDGTMTA
jgi:hypothetical protein